MANKRVYTPEQVLYGEKRRARRGHVWVFTPEGEKRWMFVCERKGYPMEEAKRRRAGTPVWEYYGNPLYKKEVPALWAELGFVTEAPEEE